MTFLETAGSTLVGVLIGSGITYLTQSRLEQRREERAQAAGRIEAARHAHMAGRLVFLDLFAIVNQLRAARQAGRWWTALLLADGAWRQHSEVLSRELDDGTWRMVAAVFVVAAQWNEMAVAARRYYWIKPHLSVRRGGLALLTSELLEAAPAAMEALRPLAVPDISDDDELMRWAGSPAGVVE
jgi:hypothetical protein